MKIFFYIQIFFFFKKYKIDLTYHFKIRKNDYLFRGRYWSRKINLLNKLKESDLEIEIIQEPVDEWLNLKDKNGKNILDCFYSDFKKWSFAFQINAFHTRIKKRTL